MSRAALVLSLTALFSTLLTGCFGCDAPYDQTILLTPEQYAEWEAGGTTGGLGGLATTADPTTAGATAGDTTGDTTGATTTSGSTGDATTGAGTTGEKLDAGEVCKAVCLSRYNDINGCSVGEKNADGFIPIECTILPFCGGRNHLCVRSHGALGELASAAAWLTRAAHDEAASVHAFVALAAELAAHGAPAALLARVQAAAADETRHAAALAGLAREHGAPVHAPQIAATPPRDLLAIACENAREGCVHETWAALSAAHQARHAAAPGLRATFAGIAADEARHAELAWALDAWLMGQLDPAERALVEVARLAAAHELQATLAAAVHGPELAELGLPDPVTTRRLATGLDAALWSRAA